MEVLTSRVIGSEKHRLLCVGFQAVVIKIETRIRCRVRKLKNRLLVGMFSTIRRPKVTIGLIYDFNQVSSSSSCIIVSLYSLLQWIYLAYTLLFCPECEHLFKVMIKLLLIYVSFLSLKIWFDFVVMWFTENILQVAQYGHILLTCHQAFIYFVFYLH